MANCEWRYAHAGGEVVNFWRWSKKLSFDEGIEALTKEIEEKTDLAILLKSPPGKSSTAKMFDTPQDAIEYLKSIDPARMDLRQKALRAKAIMEDKTEILAQAQAVAAEAKAKLDEILAKDAKPLPFLDWMYADCSTGMFAKFDPLRWRGSVTFQTAIAEFKELAAAAERDGKPQRPVFIKIPPGLKTKEEKYENFTSVIEFLEKEVGEAEHDPELVAAHEVFEEASRALADAEEQFQAAEAAVKGTEADAAAAGV